MTLVKDIVERLEQDFPKNIASEGDPVGLQIGDLNQEVNTVMTTLDVRPNVVDEAIKKHVDLIISHHPVMFRPARNLDYSNPQNVMYAKIIQNNITVYSIHTNSDKAQGGSSDWEAQELGLQEVTGFCPDTDGIPIGRKGLLPKEMTAIEFAEYVKKRMHINNVRLITPSDKKLIRRVAFIAGDGSKYYMQAVKDHQDAFITGDIYYHTGHDIIANGLTVVDPGHYTEVLFTKKMAELLTDWNEIEKWQVAILPSKVSTNPFEEL